MLSEKYTLEESWFVSSPGMERSVCKVAGDERKGLLVLERGQDLGGSRGQRAGVSKFPMVSS